MNLKRIVKFQHVRFSKNTRSGHEEVAKEALGGGPQHGTHP
jgi:hypothetical protein